MLFFDVLVLEAQTQCDPTLMVEKLYLHYTKKLIPKSKFSAKPLPNLVGNSFLVNPKDLFDDKTTDIIYKSQYIQLAGRRDYSLYKYYKQTYMDLSYFQDLDITKISHNPLLTITNNKINFKYENYGNLI